MTSSLGLTERFGGLRRFKIELFEGTLALGGEAIGEQNSCELWFDNQLVLAALTDDSEKATSRRAAPSSSPEAEEALRQGKIPQKAALRLMLGSEEYVVSFNAKAFSLSGVKIAQVIKEESEEHFIERLRLLEQLDDVICAIYEEFLALRLSPLWEAELLPVMRKWVQRQEGMTPPEYIAMLGRVVTPRNALRRGARKRTRQL